MKVYFRYAGASVSLIWLELPTVLMKDVSSGNNRRYKNCTRRLEYHRHCSRVRRNCFHAEREGSIIISTSFRELDSLTGGLLPGTLTVVAGRSSMGKTSLVLGIALHAGIQQDIGVLIFSVAAQRLEICERLLTAAARVDRARYINNLLDKNEFERIIDAASTLTSAPIFVDYRRNITVEDICETARRCRMEQDVKLVIVDSVQMLKHSGDGSCAEEQYKIGKALKGFVRSSEMTVLAVSNTPWTPANFSRENKRFSDMRLRTQVERSADHTFLIFRPETYDHTNLSFEGMIVELALAKHASEPTNTLILKWNDPYGIYEDEESG